jgi:hypothetical protein
VALSGRVPYQAQVDRPKLTLPGGKKLALWVILNVEEWRIENAMPRTVLSPPMGQPLCPTCRTGHGMNTGCGPASGDSSRR